MNFVLALKSALLGIVEGLTEFLPVSSTGHLILAGHYLNFDSPNHTFEVLIQLGAILAILSVYAGRLIGLARGALAGDSRARTFIIAVLAAFLPAVLIGMVAHKAIKEVLFTPFVVCMALISGGLVLLVVDETNFDTKVREIEDISLPMALKIGLFQCLAMIPGVSRSGATIVGAMLLGAEKRVAAEFSFFLAMPTMTGAFAYDLMKNYKRLEANDVFAIGVGFVFAFLAGLFVVRSFLGFVSRHGFVLFAWWRIAVGSIGLAAWFVYG